MTINDGICDRAQIVRNAITGKLTDDPTCFQVTEADLNGITERMRLSPPGTAVTLKAGEFRGLTGLTWLTLSGVNLSPGLPLGLFEGLSSATRLDLCSVRLTSVQAGVFAGLGSLERLTFDGNDIASLPANLLADTPKLKKVYLYRNGLDSIDGDTFNGATNLEGHQASRQRPVPIAGRFV